MPTTNVLKVPGNYLIDASNGNVTIDVTNTSTTGTVTIIGNLNVVGTATNIASVDSVISDNLIVLNSGEPNAYVTKGSSGIIIDRGTSAALTNAAQFIFDDTSYWNVSGTAKRGIFKLLAGQSNVSQGSALQLNSIRIDVASTATLNIFGDDNPLGTINVFGTTDYETRILHDDDIPNKKYVDTAIYVGTLQAKKIFVGPNTFRGYSPAEISGEFYAPNEKFEATLSTSSNIVFSLEGTEARIQGLVVNNNAIQVENGTSDLVLSPPASATVDIQGPIKLQTSSISTATSGRSTIYYSGTAGAGGTGIRFINPSQSDELVSRRRAIVFGIIF